MVRVRRNTRREEALEAQWDGVKLQEGTRTQEVPLATTTLLGRHATCTWKSKAPQVPLFWLELRWVRGWAWRALASADQTRGSGRQLPGGWRSLRAGDTLTAPGGSTVTLIEASAPEPFAVRLSDGHVAIGDALDDHIELRADGSWPVVAAHGASPLEDGACFAEDGNVWRFHNGLPPSSTLRATVNLASPGVELYVEPLDTGWTPTLQDGDASVELSAEYVRVLVPYLHARLRGIPLDGWLENDDAWILWRDAGGRADSTHKRISQDRSRLCRALTKEGVAGAASLFETVQRGERWTTRVSLRPAQLHLG